MSGGETSRQTENKDTERAVALLRGALPSANVFEATVERIRSSIRMGLFKPGAQLPPERELAELMGISRSTIRSAIQVLVDGGFLSVRRGRSGGTFVSLTSPTWPQADAGSSLDRDRKVAEILDRRRILEVGVVELAAERVSERQIGALRELVGRMAEHTDDRAAFRMLDAQFHIALGEATGNQWLIRNIAEVQSELGELIHLIPPSSEALLHSNMQHASIVAALAKADPDGARRAMMDHISGTVRFLHGLLPSSE